MSEPRQSRRVSGWTVLQVAAIVVWMAGFVIAFYFVSNFSKPSQKAIASGGQVAGLVLTGIAYLLVIYSMIKHSPDGGR